jgi:hypothetical protein
MPLRFLRQIYAYIKLRLTYPRMICGDCKEEVDPTTSDVRI